jgi:hypothetical protein
MNNTLGTNDYLHGKNERVNINEDGYFKKIAVCNIIKAV